MRIRILFILFIGTTLIPWACSRGGCGSRSYDLNINLLHLNYTGGNYDSDRTVYTIKPSGEFRMSAYIDGEKQYTSELNPVLDFGQFLYAESCPPDRVNSFVVAPDSVSLYCSESIFNETPGSVLNAYFNVNYYGPDSSGKYGFREISLHAYNDSLRSNEALPLRTYEPHIELIPNTTIANGTYHFEVNLLLKDGDLIRKTSVPIQFP